MTSESGYRLRVPASVAELVRGLHPELKARIRVALKRIIDDPYCGNALKGDLDALRSLRVQRSRIVYRLMVTAKEIEIVAIGPRKSIYQATYRIIRKSTSCDQ